MLTIQTQKSIYIYQVIDNNLTKTITATLNAPAVQVNFNKQYLKVKIRSTKTDKNKTYKD